MELIQDFLLPCLWAFLACVGFGLVYNIHGAGILICGLGGALGWFVYLAVQQIPGSGSIVAAFFAAAAIAAGKVELNHLPLRSAHEPVFAGDLFTVRGAGRWRVKAIGGKSRKDRIFITFFQY